MPMASVLLVVVVVGSIKPSSVSHLLSNAVKNSEDLRQGFLAVVKLSWIHWYVISL